MENEKEVLAQFIGATYGLVKQIDDRIIGSSTTLNKRSEDVKKILQDVVVPSASPQIPHFVTNIVPSHPRYADQVQPPARSDDGQMWLDFTDRDEIYTTLSRIESTLSEILRELKNRS